MPLLISPAGRASMVLGGEVVSFKKYAMALVFTAGFGALPVAQAAAASCGAVSPGASVGLSAFIADPSSVLESSPEGGGKLASAIRNFVIADAASLPAIKAAIELANDAQDRSIGAGLGQAATVCRQKFPDVVAQIQETIVIADKREVLSSFQAVVQDTLTTAVADGDPSLPDPSTQVTETNPGGSNFIARTAGLSATADATVSPFAKNAAASGSSTTLFTVQSTARALLSASPSR